MAVWHYVIIVAICCNLNGRFGAKFAGVTAIVACDSERAAQAIVQWPGLIYNFISCRVARAPATGLIGTAPSGVCRARFTFTDSVLLHSKARRLAPKSSRVLSGEQLYYAHIVHAEPMSMSAGGDVVRSLSLDSIRKGTLGKFTALRNVCVCCVIGFGFHASAKDDTDSRLIEFIISCLMFGPHYARSSS